LRVVSPAAQASLALGLYLIAWAVADALPLLAHLTRSQLDQLSPDPNFYVWSIRWWPHALGHLINPLHPTVIGAPRGVDLAWTNSTPALALLLSPLTLTAGPVATFNILVFLSLPLSAWTAFILCRRLTGGFWPALVGGTVYGFSAFEANHILAGQLNLAVSFVFPLLAYLVLAWFEHSLSGRVLVGLLVGALLLEFFISMELFAEMTGLWLVALVLGLLISGVDLRRRVLHLAGNVATAYVVTFALLSPYLAYALSHMPPRFVSDAQHHSMDLLSSVVPRPGQTLGIGWLAQAAGRFPAPLRDDYIGIPLICVLVLLVASVMRSRFTRFLMALLGIVVVVALGPELDVGGRPIVALPWAPVWRLPVIRSAFPARLMVFGFLILGVLLAVWLKERSRHPWARWLAAGLVLAFMAANLPALKLSSAFSTPGFFTGSGYRQVLRAGETVLVLPDLGNEGMLWQAGTDMYFRSVGGFVGVGVSRSLHGNPAVSATIPPVGRLRAGRLSGRKVQAFRSFLVRRGVGAILVDRRHPGGWPEILGKLGYRSRELGGVLFYRT
jgi:hypothetical protein